MTSDSQRRTASPVRRVRAVLFDFDGTLTLPGHLDFAAMRRAIGCPPGGSLLKHVESITDPEERSRASQILDRFEADAADRSIEDPDAAGVVAFCRDHDLRLGIITRNSRASVDRSFARFKGIHETDFAAIITRDDPIAAKPAPDGVHEACRRIGVDPEGTFVVGDFLYDIEAGERAGATTVFYDSDRERSFDRPQCDYAIERLGELVFLLSLHLPLPAGKVPNEMLAYFLADARRSAEQIGSGEENSVGATDSAAAANEAALLVGPGVGEDVAAVSLSDTVELVSTGPAGARRNPAPRGAAANANGLAAHAAAERVLLLKSDPVTFVSEGFGRFLLTVNANDIATAGGTPRWLLATLLAPPGTLAGELAAMFRDLVASCRRAGVALCGGHTELTSAVARPVVTGTMVGTVSAGRLISKTGLRTGDALLLTKGVAVEGTAILASDHRHLLSERGVDAGTIDRAAALVDRMSILPEASLAADHGGIGSMHDVTEGGVATALHELSVAGGHRLRVELDAIPVLPETRTICEALGLDPLGLIGSGSLLICVRKERAAALQDRLEQEGITVAPIGEVLEKGEGIEACADGRSVAMPRFAADELTRIV